MRGPALALGAALGAAAFSGGGASRPTARWEPPQHQTETQSSAAAHILIFPIVVGRRKEARP